MEQLIEEIRRAVADDAPAMVKEAGAKACRAILAALETEPGKPLATAAAGVEPGQALDLLIAKLSAMVPDHKAPAPALRIPTARR